MNRKLSKIKILLIGFVFTKALVTIFYFTGTFFLPQFLFTHETAVAQDAEPPAADPAEMAAAVAAEKERQFAEVQALMDQLEVKRLKLNAEEEAIAQERKQLEQLKRDIDQKLDELSAVQASIDASLDRKAEMEAQAQKAEDEADAAKLKQLVKVYTSMSPKQAAKIVDKLDMQVVYEVFSSMKGEQVGSILTYVSEERAAEITERLAADAMD
jgi:flagellar motility protein MotE (MotC chaperone)